MEENKILISAKTAEEYASTFKMLGELPNSVCSQITKAHYNKLLNSVECCLELNEENPTYIPNTTESIKDFGDYIGIFSGKFFFKIEKKECEKQKVHFVFVSDLGIK
jgi:hypothetical protein